MRTSGEARTQAFAGRLITEGYNGMLVRSFAPGATSEDMNLVLWRWSTSAPARLVLIDEHAVGVLVDVDRKPELPAQQHRSSRHVVEQDGRAGIQPAEVAHQVDDALRALVHEAGEKVTERGHRLDFDLLF